MDISGATQKSGVFIKDQASRKLTGCEDFFAWSAWFGYLDESFSCVANGSFNTLISANTSEHGTLNRTELKW